MTIMRDNHVSPDVHVGVDGDPLKPAQIRTDLRNIGRRNHSQEFVLPSRVSHGGAALTGGDFNRKQVSI